MLNELGITVAYVSISKSSDNPILSNCWVNFKNLTSNTAGHKPLIYSKESDLYDYIYC